MIRLELVRKQWNFTKSIPLSHHSSTFSISLLKQITYWGDIAILTSTPPPAPHKGKGKFVLLRLTNLVMTKTASTTNKATLVGNKSKQFSAPTPPAIRRAKQDLSKAHRNLGKQPLNPLSKQNFKSAQKSYKLAIRTNRVREGYKRDQKLF